MKLKEKKDLIRTQGKYHTRTQLRIKNQDLSGMEITWKRMEWTIGLLPKGWINKEF